MYDNVCGCVHALFAQSIAFNLFAQRICVCMHLLSQTSVWRYSNAGHYQLRLFHEQNTMHVCVQRSVNEIE